MRRLISVLIAAFAVLALVAGSAMAGSETEYTVKKGDSLWKIAHRTWSTGKLWPKIAEANGISDPKKLRVGQKLAIPEIKEVIRITQHNTSPYGARAAQGDPKILKAIGESFYAPEVKMALKKYVSENPPSPYILMKGEKAECVSDKFGVYCAESGYEFAWEKIGALRADIWSTEFGNKKYEILVIFTCGNFASRSFEVPKVEAPPVIVPTAPIVPSESQPVPPAAEKPPVLKKPELRLPPVKKPEIKLPIPACCPPEHEPIIGAGAWVSGLAHGNWYYAEYMAWLKPNCDSEYSYGAGFYLNGETGDSLTSAYKWSGFGAGPQVGVKRYWFYADKFGVDRPQQWTVKARFMWETLHGGNPETGYSNRQNDKKVGVYAEYIRQMSEKWQGSFTVEGWYNFNRHLTTTWFGDKPSDRTQINLAAWAQYKINEDWQVRFGGGPFYQGWDRLIGLHLRAEGRYKEIVMLGPYANLFPWKTSAYKGVPLHKLQTVGDFVRVEFGPIIRDWDHARRAKRIQKFQRELNPEGTPEPVTIPPSQDGKTPEPFVQVPVQETSPKDVIKITDSAKVELDKIAEPDTIEGQTAENNQIKAQAWPNDNK